MLMSKETATHIIIKHFGSFTDEIVTTRQNKRTRDVVEIIEPLARYSAHPTGYRHQLELQGYEVVK